MFAITVVVFGVELAGGLLANSLALLADAGHMFTDVAVIGLALAAIWFAGRPATKDRCGAGSRHILAAPGVGDVHDLHAWTITSGMSVESAHAVLRSGAEPLAVLDHCVAACRATSTSITRRSSSSRPTGGDSRR